MFYSVIMFICGAVFAVISILIYKGRTDLIHDYHKIAVKDEKAYGRDFGKASSGIALSLIVSGIIALFGPELKFMLPAIAVLSAGLALSIVLLIKVQNKHNGGIF